MSKLAMSYLVPMNPWVTMFGLLCLSGITIQDFRSRSIWVGWFPLLLGLAIWTAGIANQWHLPWAAWAASLAFLVFELAVVSLYLRWRTSSWDWRGKLGLGDILFWVSIIPFFGFSTYIGFHLASLFFGLIGHLISAQFTISNKIPLAGYQALLLGLFIIYLYFNANMRDLLYFV